MSLIAAGSSDEKIQKINAKQIGQAIETVFAKLAKLVSMSKSGPQSLFDYHASQILRNNARCFSQAVQHQLLALDRTSRAAQCVIIVLEKWNGYTAQARVNSLLWLNKLARMPQQQFLDSLSAYAEARMGLSMLFEQLIKENGANAVIESEPLTFWNFFNFGTISVQKMATDLIQNIKQLETTTLAFHQWISDMEAAMHHNLQDENTVAAFYAPLAECPFWSGDCQSELQINTSKVDSVEYEISHTAHKYEDTFPNIILTLEEILDANRIMRDQSELPEPKVVIPKQRRYTVIPSLVLVGQVDPLYDGSFQISLEGIDKMDSKTSCVRMEMLVRALHNRLQEVAVWCRFYPKDNPSSPLHISECFPQRASDLNKDPQRASNTNLENLELRYSSVDLLEWQLSCKSLMWGHRSSAISMEIPFSFSLDHTTDVEVEVEVEFQCQARWSMKSRHHSEKAMYLLQAP